MIKTDSPVRAHSEMEDEGYKAFTKDKRTRTTRSNNEGAIYTSFRREGATEGSERFEKRRSYNPNFTRDNQLIDHNRRQGEYRSERRYDNREGGYNREHSFNRERSFNREERPAYNREGGERNFNREERPKFNRERRYDNREERPNFNRERRYDNREGGYNREHSFNRERSFNREERPAYNREGGERNFNREERPNFNREGGYGKPRFTKTNHKGSFAHSFERKPRTERRAEPKKFVNTANHYTIENYPTYEAPQQEGAIRLNRYISMSGICSRREADEFIASGEITVNGVVVTELGSKVMPNDVVCYNGKQIENEKKVYIVMNKPKGFVTTLDDPHADKSVMDLVKNACTERIYPVGRLDKNSVGVLLLTNDGDLAKRLTHPTYEKKKIYQVSLDKHLTRADMEQMILGITLEDGDIAADDICYVDDPKMKNAVGIEIHSGRNRIVRRMFEHMGYHVGKLDRVYFAGLTKQKLKRGEWRFLTDKEVAMLKSGSYE